MGEEMNSVVTENQKSFWTRYGGTIVMAVLIFYIIILSVGAIAEIFDLDYFL